MLRPLPLPLLLLVCVLGAVTAGPAAAASVSSDGSTVTYTAGPGELNRVLVTVGNYDTSCGGLSVPCLNLSDSARITPGAGCVLMSSTVLGDSAACTLPQVVHGSLGDGEDAWWDWNGPSVVDAGPGNDNPIDGYGGNDELHGGPGNDVLIGGEGNDTVDGGLGDDDLEGIPGGNSEGGETTGSDVLIGGGGVDAVTYEGRTEPLSLTPDGVANDGAAGENDNIASDITTIIGGVGNDTMTGNASRTIFSGGPGDDTMDGADGDDVLYGGSGNDHLSGGPGQDLLEGDDGDDVLDGGADLDQYFGDWTLGCSPGSCPSGRDQILARDGIGEPIDCGAGIDSAQVDATDVITTSVVLSNACENVDAVVAGSGSPSPAGGTSSPSGGGAGPAAGLTLASVTAGRGGRAVVRVSVAAAGRLVVKATARVGGHTLTVGQAARKVAAAGDVRLTLQPSAGARRALRRSGRLRARLTATLTPAGGGKAARTTGTVTLRR
jgi:hypothetical protein